MPRLAHVAATFAIVLMAYWAYAVVAVPLIEPAAEPMATHVGPDPPPSEPAKTRRRVGGALPARRLGTARTPRSSPWTRSSW